MVKRRFIGDVHGKYRAYRKIIKGCKDSIQLGDMGIGFRRAVEDGARSLENPPHAAMAAGNHRFTRGNHDNPSVCRRHSQFIPDGHYEDGIMFVGGAQSIDRAHRTEGYDWWPEEELSIAELSILIDAYIARKPNVMVTHDCPDELGQLMQIVAGRKKLHLQSRTRQAFQAMISAHAPKLWVFGHWHTSFDQIAQGTRFVCLNELEVRDLECG